MAVSTVTIASPPQAGVETANLRLGCTVNWTGGTGPFDITYEWDDNTGFTSPITVVHLGETGTQDTGIPTSDMGPAGTDWYLRVTILDTADAVDEIQTVYFGDSTPAVTVSHDAGTTVGFLTDGDLTTNWNSGVAQNAAVIQIDIDSGAAITLDNIRVYQAVSAVAGRCESLKIYWSDDGSAYTAIGTYGVDTAGWNDMTFSALTHRYWRIEDNGSTGNWMTMYQIQLVGSATAGTFRLSHDSNVTEDLEWDAPFETSVKEVQSIYNNSTSGNFTLSFDGQGPTGNILYNDSAANVETALEGLSNITAVTVTGAGTSGDPWIVTFEDVVSNVPMITADDTGMDGSSTIAEDTQGNLSVKDALEDLASITTVSVTGVVSSYYDVEFNDPGEEDVVMIVADDDSLTPTDFGIAIIEDLEGSPGVEDQAPATYVTIEFLDVEGFYQYLYVDQNIGVNFGTTGVGDGNPDDFFRYLYANHNVGVGFGFDPFDDLVLGDGDPDAFDRFLHVNHNVTGDQPCPWLASISPTLQEQGGTVTLYGDSFGALQSTYTTEIRLYETQDLLGGSYVTMSAIAWADDEVTVTVPTGATTGYVAVVHTNVGATCDGSAFKLLNVELSAADPDMGWWIQTVDKQNQVTADATIIPNNVTKASFKKIMNSIGSGIIELPLAEDDIELILDPLMRKGTLIRVFLDDRFRYAFYAEKLAHDYDEEGNAIARITGRGMEVVSEWSKLLPHDYPAAPSQAATWVYGSTENFIQNPGFDDEAENPTLKNPGGEDGNTDAGAAQGWRDREAEDGDLTSIVGVEDSIYAFAGDWYIQVAATAQHAGMEQSVSVEPGRTYHVRAQVREGTAAGMRVTLALGGAEDIGASGTYTNNYVYNSEVLAELDNVAEGLGTSDGTWQQLDVEVVTGSEQTSLTIAVQDDDHAAIHLPFGVEIELFQGWGIGLSPWEPYTPSLHAFDSYRVNPEHTFDGSSYAAYLDVNQNGPGLQQLLEVTPNTRYTFSCWLWPTGTIDFWALAVVDADGVFVQGFDLGDNVQVDQWNLFKYVYTTASDETELYVRFTYEGIIITNPAPAWVDSFSAVPGEDASTAGFILNQILDKMALVGKLTYLSRTFTDTEDSAGVAWPANLSLDISPSESLYGVLARFVALGHEWEIVPDNFIEGGETGFSLNVFTSRSFNPDSGIGTSHVSDPAGPVITPGDATLSGKIVKTAFNTNTVFALGEDGVWSTAQQFPYEDIDVPPSDPAPFGYKTSFGIIEEAISVSANDTTTVSSLASARLVDEKGRERALQLRMQRASDVRPFLVFGVGDSMFIDMPPDNIDVPDPTTGLRTYPKRIRAIMAELSGGGSDVVFNVDIDRVVYEDELGWLAMIAQLAERSPVENSGQGTGRVSGSGGAVSVIGGGTGGSSSIHTHALDSSEITDRATSGDISGTLPGPLSVNKLKGLPVDVTVPTEVTSTETALVYDHSNKILELKAGVAGVWGAWTDVDAGVGFENSWVNFGGTAQDLEYRKHADGMIQIRGRIKTGSVGSTAFTLPTGYRPPDTLNFAADSNGAFGNLQIVAAGTVTPVNGSNSYFAVNVMFDSTGGS